MNYHHYVLTACFVHAILFNSAAVNAHTPQVQKQAHTHDHAHEHKHEEAQKETHTHDHAHEHKHEEAQKEAHTHDHMHDHQTEEAQAHKETPAHDHAHAHQHEEAHTPEDGHQHAADDAHQHAEEAIISAALAAELGIRVAPAAAGTIERHIPLYGELVLPAKQQAQVRARFPGVIKRLSVAPGDSVRKGEQVALIESNDSLRTYPLTAPISGIVSQQFVTEGEYTSGEPLLTVFDASQLLAELKVFPSQLNAVKAGLPVHLETRNGRIDSRINHLLPVAGQPYVLARVLLDNSQGQLVVGEPLSALVDAEIISVALVVDNLALQEYEGKPVVFVQTGNRYSPRALQLGRTDGRATEVLAGLTAGELYVVAQSYLLKAELEKSAAAHEH